MDDTRNTRRERPAGPSGAPLDPTEDDAEGHSATIYRRRRGPYPLRAAALPEAEDRVRREGGASEGRRPIL